MKKFLSMILVLCMILTMGVPVLADDPSFSDIDGHWAEDTINKWKATGVIAGYPDGTFRPDAAVTRAELAKILALAFDLQTKTTPEYTDVQETDWYYPYLERAARYIPVYNLPIASSDDSPYLNNPGGFLPNVPAMRIHTADALIEIERNKLPLMELPPISEIKEILDDKFNDIEYENLFTTIHGVAFNVQNLFEYTYLAVELGIMEGYPDDYFRPGGDITRAELLTMLDKVIALVTEEENHTSFADALNAQMPTDENYMFSPLSIRMILALTANGAVGETKTEMLNALGISGLPATNMGYKTLIEDISKVNGLTFQTANSIWTNVDASSMEYSEPFKNIATEFYNADVKTVNQSNAVEEINAWISDKTNGKITEAIYDADFEAMLVNTVYFNGLWEHDFYEGATKPDTFHNADGTITQTDFMNETSLLQYTKTEEAEIISLPYRVEFGDDEWTKAPVLRKGYRNISMYLIATDETIDVGEELDNAIRDQALKTTSVRLSMPKFKFEYDVQLSTILKNLGMNKAFNVMEADFGAMFDQGNSWITDVMHQTFISVDEKGTEAAAATEVMVGKGMATEPIELKFNKPFYFVIRDNASGEILFMGRFATAK